MINRIYREGVKMTEPKDQRYAFTLHCLIGIVLSAVRRNGIDKTIEDLQKSCRLSPKSDEHIYQDLLAMLNDMSEKHESIIQNKNNLKNT